MVLFMRKVCSFLLVFFIMGLAVPLFAQEEDEEETPVIEWDSYIPDLYRAGDKVFTMTAGIVFPTIFTGEGMKGAKNSNLKLGGTGLLSFSYFLAPSWFIGGELQGSFIPTGGKNMLFIVPVGFYVGYQFVIGRFEIPVRIMTGIAPQRYMEKGYFGLIIKPGASVFYRLNADWSFGLNFQWWMLPQWPKNEKNVLGNFMEISFSARYHF